MPLLFPLIGTFPHDASPCNLTGFFDGVPGPTQNPSGFNSTLLLPCLSVSLDCLFFVRCFLVWPLPVFGLLLFRSREEILRMSRMGILLPFAPLSPSYFVVVFLYRFKEKKAQTIPPVPLPPATPWNLSFLLLSSLSF